MNAYLQGSVRQLIERGRQLCGKIPRNLPRDYDTLARTCRDRLTRALEQLRSLLEDPIFQFAEYQPERLRLFKRLVAELDMIETVGIAALDRAKEDDHRLNELLERIAKEIRYPLETPVVTTLSQQYFCIVTELSLLCVPLTEGRFLLHLPDLYHELAHPLLTAQDDPIVEPFQQAMLLALRETMSYLATETAKEDRRWGPQHPGVMLRRWEVSWVKFWMVEFFCDLFAVYTLGPAFVWAHLHLSAKRGENPYEVPVFGTSSHPADDARMRAMLVALRIAGFSDTAEDIEGRWNELLKLCGFVAEPEYFRCFPADLIESIALHAQTGVRSIGCRYAEQSTNDKVHTTLNSAWDEFWARPEGYVDWERAAVEALST